MAKVFTAAWDFLVTPSSPMTACADSWETINSDDVKIV